MQRIPLRMKEQTKPNPCDGCKACCTVLAISELDPPKPNWKNCIHECEKGCNIYDGKPTECSEYRCLFADGVFGQSIAYRPDKLGLIIDMRGDAEVDFMFVQMWEVRPNARFEQRAKAMIERFLDTGKVGIVLRKYEERQSKFEILGRKKQIEQITAWFVMQSKYAEEEYKKTKNPKLLVESPQYRV